MPLVVTTAPTLEPLTVQEAKDHLRVDHDSDDALIAALIVAAREYVQTVTGRQLMTATLKLLLDRFPSEDHSCWPAGHSETAEARFVVRLAGGIIKLPRPPVQSISSVKYYDTGGTQQTLAASGYQYDLSSQPARLAPAYGLSWPSTREMLGAVEVNYLAGYASAALVPASDKLAMLLLIGHWYENRGAIGQVGQEIALAVNALLWQERIVEFA